MSLEYGLQDGKSLGELQKKWSEVDKWKDERRAESDIQFGIWKKFWMYVRVEVPDDWFTSIETQKEIQEHVFELVEELQKELPFVLTWTVGYHATHVASWMWYEGGHGERIGHIAATIHLRRSWLQYEIPLVEVLERWQRREFPLKTSEHEWLFFWVPALDAKDNFDEEVYMMEIPESSWYPFEYFDREYSDSLGS